MVFRGYKYTVQKSVVTVLFNKAFVLAELALTKLKLIGRAGGKRDWFFANYFSSKM